MYEVRQKCRNIEGESSWVPIPGRSVVRGSQHGQEGLAQAEQHRYLERFEHHGMSAPSQGFCPACPTLSLLHTLSCHDVGWSLGFGTLRWVREGWPLGFTRTCDLLAFYFSSPSLPSMVVRTSCVCLPWPSLSGSGPSGLGKMGQEHKI